VVCPECGKECARTTMAGAESGWHLNVAVLTVIQCADTAAAFAGARVKTVRVPWAEKDSRFTVHFESLAIRSSTLFGRLPKRPICCIDWDGVQRIVDRRWLGDCCGARPRGCATWARREEQLWPRPALRLDRHRHQRSTVLEVVRANDRRPEESLCGLWRKARTRWSSSHGH